MVDNRDEEIEINRIRARLASLKVERAELEASLAEIKLRKAGTQTISACTISAENTPTVNTTSPRADKVALFRRLFAGRSDVFPLRWENAKTGKSGYAPACANEWIRGVCGKPQIKCGECPHQAFIPVTDGIIDKHLRGGDGQRAFVAGVYPMLPNETCWFLAADFDKESWASDAAAMVETVADRPRTYRAFARLATSSKLAAEMSPRISARALLALCAPSRCPSGRDVGRRTQGV